MFIRSNIAANIKTVQTNNFRFSIVFALSRNNLLDTDSFDLSNLRVTGSDHISISNFSLINVSEGVKAAFVSVELPAEVSGSFVIDVAGNITVDGISQKLIGPSKTIEYNTIRTVTMRLG